MINKIIHQIWVGKYNIPQREIRFSNEVKEKHPTYEYKLWTDNNLPEIPTQFQEMYNIMYNNRHYVNCADILRWLVVYKYGGWYLDIDFEFIQNLDVLNLDHRNGIVFGHWGDGWQHCDYTVTNNVFGFEKENSLVKHMIDTMPIELNYGNGPHSPGWTGIAVKNYLGLENEFSKEIWEYHRVMRENLDKYNVEYGDYNGFMSNNLRHHALYSNAPENILKFERGEML